MKRVLPPEDIASAVAEVDLGALRRNVDRLRTRAPGLDIIAVVKANAYGHGAVEIARALAQYGVRQFAVATLREAVQLRESGLDERILVFAAPIPEQLQHYAERDLEVTVTSAGIAEAATEAARHFGALRVHLKVDTGMGRIGIRPEEAERVIRGLEQSPGVELVGLWTHFASADRPDDPFTRGQWTRFSDLMRDLGGPPAPVHVANSGDLLSNRVALDPSLASGMRVGISLYGIYDPPEASSPAPLEPVMRLVSRITHIKEVAEGTPISYGSIWKAPRPTRIATIAVGYADGYRRALSNKSWIGVHGAACPIAGRVCMDMIMADLGPGAEGPDARPGDEAVLFGVGGPSVFDHARWADTITYEIVCGITDRVTRRYLPA